MKKNLLLLTFLFCLARPLCAQFVYVIKADSVKITNQCDTAELILENHTKDIPGFLFNKGKGRTEFRRGLIKGSDSIYLIGSDTLKTVPPYLAWLTPGNAAINAYTNFLGTRDSASLVFRTNYSERMRLTGTTGNLLLGTATDNGQKLQVNGDEWINGKLNLANSDNTGKSAVYKGSDVFMSSYNGNNTFPPSINSYDNSVYIGRGSGNFTNNSIGFNSGIGYQVLQNFTTGYNNAAYGIWSLQALTTGVNNTAGSPYALQHLTTGIENTALGTAALTLLTTGGQNTALGTYAGSGATGSLNVFVGFKAGYDETGSNKLYIANSSTHTPLIYGDFSTNLLTINGGAFITGKTYLGGNTSPAALLHLSAGTATAGTAPAKLTAGTVLTTPEDGAIEYDGTDFYFTQATTRYKLSKALTGQLTTSFGGISVPAGNIATATISVAGAQAGDVVMVSSNSGAANPQSIIISAFVTTAGSVTLQAYNSSGSSVTLASDTFKVKIIR